MPAVDTSQFPGTVNKLVMHRTNWSQHTNSAQLPFSWFSEIDFVKHSSMMLQSTRWQHCHRLVTYQPFILAGSIYEINSSIYKSDLI